LDRLDPTVHRRVDFDTTVTAMALTAKEMNAKYRRGNRTGGAPIRLTAVREEP